MLVVLSALAAAASAQQDPAIQLRQEMQREQRQEELKTAPALAPIAGTPELDARPSDLPEPKPILRSPAIRVNANGLLATEEIEALIEAYKHLDLGRERIALLLRQLNAALVRQGPCDIASDRQRCRRQRELARDRPSGRPHCRVRQRWQAA